jgi:hypothetical protein
VSFPTIENAAILSMWLSMPLGGTWQAKVDSEAEALAGTVTISDGEGQAFVGRVVRSGVVTDRNRAFVVGGRGKIGDGGFTLSSKHFRAVNMRVIVNEILTQAGETLSPTSPAPLLATHFDFWTIPGGNGATPGSALRSLLSPFDAAWRMLSDGTVWIGIDTFPAAPEQDRLELEPHADQALVCLAVDAFALRPGVTLDGRKVLQVDHRFDDEGRRTDYRYG